MLDKKGKLNWQECFGDGTFSAAKKRGDKVGKTQKGKGIKIMVITEGIPLVAGPESANPAEVTLVESTLSKVRVPGAGRGRPKKRLG
ncbi:hypothetical protein FACS189454_04200 [Planctomycetales bacterium]|nr:hypothetical protein FACS189454_04200 [Planctomycetales bacterium]